MAQSRSPITPISLGRRHEGSARVPTAQGDAMTARPHTLPAPLTRFIGRAQEMAEVGALLGTARLLTLTGSGGCGKTRLALALATARADEETPGVDVGGLRFIEFAGLTDPALVPQAVAAALGVHEEPHRPLLDTLTDALSADAPLLVLDNCEHLIAAVAHVVDALLRGCPRLRILATSREALRVPGEVTWRVPSLSLPGIDAPLAESEAVQLFVDRVRLRQPAFALTDENAATVAAICQRLDGMPLALELAAARACILPRAQLEGRLEDALRLLTGGARTALPRHQTLRATLDWSYALLTEEERIVLQRLATFAGGCDLAAAAAVCGGDGIAGPGVLHFLAQLAEKSLVQMDERHGNARYRLLETVRQYAGEQLAASDEEEAVRSAHAAWYLALARKAGTGLDGPEQEAWLEQLGPELDNVRAAMQWLLNAGQIGHGLRFTAHLWRFWYTRDHVTEGSHWLMTFLARGRETGEATRDPSAWMGALSAASRLAIFGGHYREGRALGEEMLATAREHHDPYHVAAALTLLGLIALEQGDYPSARAHYEEGLPFAREANHLLGQAVLIGHLGITLTMQGTTAAARPIFDESMALLQSLGDVGQISRLFRWQGILAIIEGDAERAQALLIEALVLHQRLHSVLGIAESLEIFAALAAMRGQFARAFYVSGAAENLRATIAAPVPPFLREWLAAQIEPARRALGTAESAAALTAGKAMTTDQAIAEALASAYPVTSGDRRTIKEKYGGLSARERDVVTEIAHGKANREIASALFITEKTVEWHVGNSLRKLNFRARAELAVWAVAVGLAASPHAAQKEAPTS
jgi:predicted ATPase/DNA-binding CsgD family transcriptional regulator